MMKKFLALLLALCLCLSIFPATALAADEDFVIANGVLTKYKGSGGLVIIPDGTVTIGWGAFRDVKTVTEIIIPDSVTTIETYAFDGCTALKRITLGKNVTTIDHDAFQDCTSLTEITFPDSVTTIGDYVFRGCNSLKRVKIGIGLANLGQEIFHNCPAIEDLEIPSQLELSIAISLLRSGNPANLVIPEGVTELKQLGMNYRNQSKLVSITLPDSITAIPEGVFWGCKNLERVDLGNGIKTIEANAFIECSSLTSIKFSDALTSIGKSAFQNCTSLSTVNLPQKLTSIGRSAFQGCSSLSALTLPDSLVTLEDYAFQNCSSLTHLTVGKGLTSVGNGVFRGCDRLSDAINLEGLGESALEVKYSDFVIQNGYITEYKGSGGHVVIPEGVIGISGPVNYGEFFYYDGPFQGNTTITSITLPDSLIEIKEEFGDGLQFQYGKGPFGGCTNLKSIVFGDGLETVPDLRNLPALEQVTLPSRLTVIPSGCLSNCPNLTSITIPSSVTTIEAGAFNNSGLTSLVIPEGVKSCCDFYGYNPKLRELTLPSTLDRRPLLACPELRKLTLPKDGWAFKGISRADFMKYIQDCPMLEEIVNCPNEFVPDLIAANKTLRDNWTNPKSTIVAQSARITKLSNEITAGLTTQYDKAKAISQWVVDHIKYDYDYYYEGLKDYSDVPFDPEEILDKGQAVCAGFARLTQALLVAQGIPCLYVLGWVSEGYHAWNLAYIDGEYLWIDNTWGMKYFGLGIYAISRDHTATGAASFNNVKGPGTLVQGSSEADGMTETAEETTADNAPVLPAATGMAYASTQMVEVDGKKVEFQYYALRDENGDPTNYIKLRDLAFALNGTPAQFQVAWDGAEKSITLTSGTAYTPDGSENSTPYSGNQIYAVSAAKLIINGKAMNLAAFTLDNGGYTYFQLRELGQNLGFNVGWSRARGVFVETDKPYDPND